MPKLRMNGGLNGTEYSYAVVSYCNFTDADLAGAVFNESDLSDSDFSAAENLNAARFDDETIWPKSLPIMLFDNLNAIV